MMMTWRTFEMKVVEYTVEIIFPDDEIMNSDALHDILFHHPALKDCLVTVNSTMNLDESFRCEICGKEIEDPSYEVALEIYVNPPTPNHYEVVYVHSKCNRYDKFQYFKDSEFLIKKTNQGEKNE